MLSIVYYILTPVVNVMGSDHTGYWPTCKPNFKHDCSVQYDSFHNPTIHIAEGFQAYLKTHSSLAERQWTLDQTR